MATDLATLAIKVENGDVIKATTSLDGLTVAGGKTEAATQRLTRRMALLELEARKMDVEMREAGQANRYLSREMALAELEARKMNAAMSGITGVSAKMSSALGLSEAATSRLTKAIGALSAIAAIGFIGRKTVEETEAAQAALAQLQAAVTSTGGAAGRSVDQLDALSIALQKTTTFSDEAVKGAEAMLLTFDKIRGENFDRATAAVTDLAARMGGDLQAAAVQVGKALQDPTNGLTALRRSGVSFSESQIEVIKNLYATGRAAEGQRVILAELEHQFGGSAAAARDTLGGALKALSNAWGDLFEVSRGASQGTVTAINAITTALQGSGLSMNKILHDATVDWETMRASIEKVRAIMSLQIGPGFLEQARNIIQRIDFDLSTKIADLNKTAPPGTLPPPPPPPGGGGDAKDLAELQKATDAYYNSLNQHQIDAIHAADSSRLQNAQLRELIAAYGDSQAAVERVTIAQAGENAVKDLGVGVSAKAAAAVRREAEEHERLAIQLGKARDAQADAARDAEQAAEQAEREMERRAKELHRTVSSTIEGILTDIDNRRNPFVAIFENLKRGAIKAISDILATKIEGKVADLLGITIPATKQENAAKLMNEAADKQLRAAGVMNGKSTAGGVIIEENPAKSATLERFKEALKVGGAAYGGFQTGYGIGAATGSKPIGAIGGAVTGAALGNAIVPGLGGIVGGAAGFVGGLLGASHAAAEAAARMEEARKKFKTAVDAIVADLNGDELASALAGARDKFDELRKLYVSANLKEFFFDRDKYLQGLQGVNALEAEYLDKLRQEAAFKAQSQIESYRERQLRAEGKNAEADELGRQQERAALIQSFGKEIDATERQILAALDGAQAAEKLRGAVEALTTAVRGGPSGFKVNPYIQEFATARPRPGQFGVPTTPFLPPLSPLSPPTLSRTGTVATAPVVLNNPVFQFPNVTDGKVAAKAFLAELDKTVAATGGLNTTRAVALNKMTVS